MRAQDGSAIYACALSGRGGASLPEWSCSVLGVVNGGGVVDRRGELAQVCAERVKKAQNGVPPDPAPPALYLRDVGGMDAEAPCEFVLREVGSLSQRL